MYHFPFMIGRLKEINEIDQTNAGYARLMKSDE